MPFEKDVDGHPLYTFGRGDLVIAIAIGCDRAYPYPVEMVIHTAATPKPVGTPAAERVGELTTAPPDCLRLRFETAASLAVFIAKAVTLLEAMLGVPPHAEKAA